jgi:cytochrome b6-f complex iron-sulfur subunit
MLAFLYPVVAPEQSVEYPVAAAEAVPRNGGLVAHSPAGHVALEDDNGTLRAFSAVCTHLGCIIRWQPGQGHVWFCPCHHGTYDRAGRVVSGPPPRPLDPLPVTVRDGTVYVTLRVRPPTTLPDETPS